MNVYLDDIRTPLSPGWTIVRSYEECIRLLETGEVVRLSLDHDLGTEKTGYDVAKWIEEQVITKGFFPPVIVIHSANPVGYKNIQAAIASIQKQF